MQQSDSGTSARTRLRACIKAKGGHFEHTLRLSQYCVLANVTALTRHVLNFITLCLFIQKLYNKNQALGSP